MSKIQYVTGNGSTQKLKRNVPPDLLAVAGKTAWVERISNFSTAKAKEKSRLFAIFTDSEIAKMRAKLAPFRQASSTKEVSFELTAEEAMQIAVSYLRDRDDQCLTNGRYFLDVPKLDVTEFLAEAYEDVRTARRAVTGEECRTDPIVVKLLQERGVVPHLAEAQTVSNGWLEGLEQHRTFQLLCRLIEKADLAIAERRFNSS